MPTQDFSAQVSDWVKKTKVRMKAVRDESVQRTILAAQKPVAQGGNMPVDTGFLRASGHITTGSPIGLQPHPSPGVGSFEWDDKATTLIIKGANLKDTITWAYSAQYALFVEMGTSKMYGRRFVGLAVQQWPQIVAQVSKEAETRFGDE